LNLRAYWIPQRDVVRFLSNGEPGGFVVCNQGEEYLLRDKGDIELSEEVGLPIPVDGSWHQQEIIRKWNEGYRAAISYALFRGSTAVSQTAIHDGVNVGYWIKNRRAEYQSGRLQDSHAIELIEKIPHWVWEPHKILWLKRYQELQNAYEALGDRCLLVKAKFEGVAIGTWVRSQRVSYANGNLSSETEGLLSKLPFWTWGGLKPYRRGKAKGLGARAK
jgi:hypothetical protein